jgi:large subunit ribosomal protein L24
MQKKLHVKVGEKVIVIAGTSKGSEGSILSIDRKKNRVIVEGANMIKKHVKPSASNPQGGIVESAAGIHISNVMLVVNGEPTKTGRKDDNGKLVRYSKKTGEVIK